MANPEIEFDVRIPHPWLTWLLMKLGLERLARATIRLSPPPKGRP
jgi:hypothetical protein